MLGHGSLEAPAHRLESAVRHPEHNVVHVLEIDVQEAPTQPRLVGNVRHRHVTAILFREDGFCSVEDRAAALFQVVPAPLGALSLALCVL